MTTTNLPDEPIETFNVVQFFPDDNYEYVARSLPLREAMYKVYDFINRPAALIGVIARVIITDAGDRTLFEWKFREGITFPSSPSIDKYNLDYRKRFSQTPKESEA